MPCLEIGLMSSKRIAIFTDGNLGGTFLDWSLHFLSGADEYWHWKYKKRQVLRHNPIPHTNNQTAHGHEKNHPEGLKQVLEFIHKAKDVDGVVSFYFQPLSHDHFDGVDFTRPGDIEYVHDQRQQDLAAAMTACWDNNYQIIIVNDEASIAPYHTFHRTEDAYLARTMGHVPAEYRFWHRFFERSIKEWQKQGLVEAWDWREFVALNIRPFVRPNNFRYVTLHQPHVRINCLDYWHQTAVILQALLAWLGLPCNLDRLNTWAAIRSRWATIHTNIAFFSRRLPEVVDAIVHNEYYEMPKLSMHEEAIIQHCLIYQHNLNLRTWQLVNFPDNAQKLHELLETNFHPI